MVNVISLSMTTKNAKTQPSGPVPGLKDRSARAKQCLQGSNSSRAELLARSEAHGRARDRFRKILISTLLEGVINIAVICLIAVACARIEDETGDISSHITAAMGGGSGSPRFRRIQSFQTDYAPTTITQYESLRSGMQVIVADRKGPKINGYFVLATEIFDDSGAPHTLEHLIFMGSRSYQYKGLLDKLASRAYSGTNAWTAVDHTAYTLESAGWDGFAQILPVYLEHVIVPTITDEGCLTEVHHVDGEGNDAGVVYSEMQALENTSVELLSLRAKRLLYPENVGFRYETGGMMEALRVLTPERIREFHKVMYQPRNLALIIVGETDHENLLQILDQFEESIADVIPSIETPFQRPWIDSAQPPPIQETVVETIEFPEEDESTGEIVIAFFGPSCTDIVQSSALNVLLTYLCGSSVSVLENVMVEKEELASSIGYWWDARPDTVIWFEPTGVATEKLAYVEQRLISLLKEVAGKPLDMKYMKECISREKRQIKYQAEDSEQFYSSNIINDYLFGKRDGSTLKEMQTLDEYNVLDQWTDDQWREFLRKWLSEAKHVSVLAKPSIELADKLKKAEENRIAKRKKELGPEGLKHLAELLEAAKNKNEVAIPESVIDKWPVPGTESIHFIESKTARSGKARNLGTPSNTAQKYIDGAKSGKPLFVQFEDVPSNFVHITVHIGTAPAATRLMPLLSLFSDNFFNTPIMRNGKKIDFEDVVMELEKDTISYHFSYGSRIGDYESMILQFQLEPEKYTTIIQWIRTMLFDSVFDPQRIKACVAKALADIPEYKRDGKQMSMEVEMGLHLAKNSLPMSKRTLVKAVYLRRLKKLLEKDPETVISWFEELRKTLFTFDNTRVLVTADIAKLNNPVSAWDTLTNAFKNPDAKEMIPIVTPETMLSEEGHNPGSIGAVIIPMTTLDSSYSVSTTRGFTSYTDPRLPAFMVAVGYLEAVEGPLWNAVRGNGLAYGVSFSRELDCGLLQYKVYRSPDASKAIEASRAAVEAIAMGKAPLEKNLIEGAVSGIVMGFADEQSTMAAAAQQNYMIGVIRGLDPEWSRQMMAAVRDVTHEEIRSVISDVIMPVFRPGSSNVVVTCAPLFQESIKKALKTLGYKIQVHALSHFHDDYGFEPLQGEDDEVDDSDSNGGSKEDSSEEDESGSECGDS